jgi:succinate dehydrogenase / fumarate reductase flavoprotein subunit
MQGLADGYFVLPDTMNNYLAGVAGGPVDTDGPEFAAVEGEVNARLDKLVSIKGRRTPDSFHRELGHLMWERCGMARNEEGLTEALERIPAIRAEFWENVSIPGTGSELNQTLERAARVADFLEFAELMCYDARARAESCGAHFREEFQTEEGEAMRNDEDFCHVSAWEFQGENAPPVMHKESLEFESVELATRSYK